MKCLFKPWYERRLGGGVYWHPKHIGCFMWSYYEKLTANWMLIIWFGAPFWISMLWMYSDMLESRERNVYYLFFVWKPCFQTVWAIDVCWPNYEKDYGMSWQTGDPASMVRCVFWPYYVLLHEGQQLKEQQAFTVFFFNILANFFAETFQGSYT